jgi:hypothetical protein
MGNDSDRKIGLTKGPKLEIRSVRRGKITVDKSTVTKITKSAKFGNRETTETTEVFWVEYPTLDEPAGPYDSRYSAEKKLKDLRDTDTDCLGAMGAARVYAVAQGIARRVKTCEREIAESAKLLPEEIGGAWISGLKSLMDVCEAVETQIPYEEIWKAFEQQEKDKEKVA